jgi:hypothetical protein
LGTQIAADAAAGTESYRGGVVIVVIKAISGNFFFSRDLHHIERGAVGL